MKYKKYISAIEIKFTRRVGNYFVGGLRFVCEFNGMFKRQIYVSFGFFFCSVFFPAFVKRAY